MFCDWLTEMSSSWASLHVMRVAVIQHMISLDERKTYRYISGKWNDFVANPDYWDELKEYMVFRYNGKPTKIFESNNVIYRVSVDFSFEEFVKYNV